MGFEKELASLKNIVRIGVVSSVDVSDRTARVAFYDKKNADGQPLVSAPLNVIQNQPLITIEKWFEEPDVPRSAPDGNGNQWTRYAEYSSADRAMSFKEEYKKPAVGQFGGGDVIYNYESKEEYEDYIKGTGKPSRQRVTVYPWLPYAGQLVLCIYLPNGESDGFVIGGI